MSYVAPLIVFISLLILKSVLKEKPPLNVLRYIGYRRNVIRLYFARETVQEPIYYAYGSIDTNTVYRRIVCFWPDANQAFQRRKRTSDSWGNDDGGEHKG